VEKADAFSTFFLPLADILTERPFIQEPESAAMPRIFRPLLFFAALTALGWSAPARAFECSNGKAAELEATGATQAKIDAARRLQRFARVNLYGSATVEISD
jgi:hypothetical protein